MFHLQRTATSHRHVCLISRSLCYCFVSTHHNVRKVHVRVLFQQHNTTISALFTFACNLSEAAPFVWETRNGYTRNHYGRERPALNFKIVDNCLHEKILSFVYKHCSGFIRKRNHVTKTDTLAAWENFTYFSHGIRIYYNCAQKTSEPIMRPKQIKTQKGLKWAKPKNAPKGPKTLKCPK